MHLLTELRRIRSSRRIRLPFFPLLPIETKYTMIMTLFEQDNSIRELSLFVSYTASLDCNFLSDQLSRPFTASNSSPNSLLELVEFLNLRTLRLWSTVIQ